MTYDTTRPNSAGIYDYLLGGTHNTAADRAAGEQFRSHLPNMVQGMRYNRYFLFDAVEQFAQSGLTHYIDLATGYPTEEDKEGPDAAYPHTYLSPSAKIVYNDIHPDVVAYSRQLIGDRPNIVYVQSDVRDIDTILRAAEALFGSERQVGTSFTGLIYFLSDADVRHIFQRLHQWAASGSQIAVTTFDADQTNPDFRAMADMSQQMRQPIYPRGPQALLELAAPWHGTLERIETYVQHRMQRTIELSHAAGNEGYVGILSHS